MPRFSERSKLARSELHLLLKQLVDQAIIEFDFVILDGTRGRAEQELAFKQGNSKAHFGDSAHNYKPAIAMDIVPYPIDWNDTKRFITLQFEIIKPAAKRLGIPIRQGLDWNMNGSITDEKFKDFPHVELHPWRQWAKESQLVKD
jgi:peptidoglycan L-alanyl-D-glutamate endopeptidase CwlK